MGYAVTRQLLIDEMPGKDFIHLSTHGTWALGGTRLTLRDESEQIAPVDVRGYNIRTAIETYAVVKKGKQSGLQAEFAFNARIKTERGQLVASASRSQIGGMTYVF